MAKEKHQPFFMKQWELMMELKCESVSLLLLNKLFNKFDKIRIGLFKDDGFAIFKKLPYLKCEWSLNR